MTMKVRINSLLKLVSGITNASALFLPFVVSIYCNTSNLNNPNDLGSRSFLQIKAIECILKSPNCPTGPTLGYSASSFLFPQNFSISTVSPTVSEIISSCSSSPALPLGLSLSSGCLITGTPTTLQSSTRYAISASGANGSMNANINITIFIGALVQLNFDNGSLSDSGTLGISLSSTTGTPIKVTGKDGDSNGAYSFGGADFFSTALNGDTGLPLGANSRTMCAWILPSVLPTPGINMMAVRYGTIVASQASALGIGNIGGVQHIAFFGNSYDAVAGPGSSISLINWMHLCATIQGTNASLFLNGSLVDSLALPGLLNTVPNVVSVGRYTAGSFWQGSIDDVRIYGQALTANEINQVYQGIPVVGP